MQIDDLLFYQCESQDQATHAFGPRLGSSKSEQNWTLLWTISSLISILDHVSSHVSRADNDEAAPSKRPRLASRIDEVTRDCISATGTRKVYCLQLLSFLESRVSIETKASFLGRLAASIVDDNPATATWTLLAIHR